MIVFREEPCIGIEIYKFLYCRALWLKDAIRSPLMIFSTLQDVILLTTVYYT